MLPSSLVPCSATCLHTCECEYTKIFKKKYFHQWDTVSSTHATLHAHVCVCVYVHIDTHMQVYMHTHANTPRVCMHVRPPCHEMYVSIDVYSPRGAYTQAHSKTSTCKYPHTPHNGHKKYIEEHAHSFFRFSWHWKSKKSAKFWLSQTMRDANVHAASMQSDATCVRGRGLTCPAPVTRADC